MRHVDLVFCHSPLLEGAGGPLFKMLLEKTVGKLGLDYTVHKKQEGGLLDTNFFPKDAVVYFHAGKRTRYRHVGIASRLADQRKDLSFIAELGNFARDKFGSQEDYYLIKKAVTDGFNAANRFVISDQKILHFLAGKRFGETPETKLEDSLEKYLKQWVFVKTAREVKRKRKKRVYMFCFNDRDGPDCHNGDMQWGMEEVIKTKGISYIVRTLPEYTLEYAASMYADMFPQGAIIYVHGNNNQLNPNVTPVRKLAEKRPDLRIILQVDPLSGEDKFKPEENHAYVKSLLEQDFGADRPVMISPYHISRFIRGVDRFNDPSGEGFSDYLDQYLALEAQDGKA